MDGLGDHCSQSTVRADICRATDPAFIPDGSPGSLSSTFHTNTRGRMFQSWPTLQSPLWFAGGIRKCAAGVLLEKLMMAYIAEIF